MEDKNKQILRGWMNDYDMACITAYRDEYVNATPRTLNDRPNGLLDADTTRYRYKASENAERNRNLKASLLKLGYGVTDIHGVLFDNCRTIGRAALSESSFLVVNLNHDSDFRQRLFELSEYYNQDGFILKRKGRDEAYRIGTNWGEYPGYGKEVHLGELYIDMDNEYVTGEKALGLDVYENYSRGARMSIKAISYETMRHIGELKNAR